MSPMSKRARSAEKPGLSWPVSAASPSAAAPFVVAAIRASATDRWSWLPASVSISGKVRGGQGAGVCLLRFSEEQHRARQERRHGLACGKSLDAGVGDRGQVVGAGRAEFGRELGGAARFEFGGAELGRQAARGGGAEGLP